MNRMFSSCTNLTNIDISHLDTTNVTDMGGMFSACKNLTQIDISTMNTTNVTNMTEMFAVCSNLETIYSGSTFDKSNLVSSESMFSYSTKIVGGNGTTFNWSHNDASYACVDTPETPGYFTLKVN